MSTPTITLNRFSRDARFALAEQEHPVGALRHLDNALASLHNLSTLGVITPYGTPMTREDLLDDVADWVGRTMLVVPECEAVHVHRAAAALRAALPR